jgi:rhamnopyranosyl-N-acetylglucosaminyl-diphospho-decaprenol beta-1,3/1,4-galactofuranosyltransferase
MQPAVVAVTATFHRTPEISRLITSLGRSRVPLAGMVITDNGDDPGTREAAERAPFSTHRLVPGRNLGCGGGLAAAEREALERFPGLTHVLVLDDDAEVLPDAIGEMIKAIEAHSALFAHALVEAKTGEFGWYPGLLDREKFRAAKTSRLPEDYIARAGEDPAPFEWCLGIAMLVTRQAMDRFGVHRDDYWVRGEDLEFSLRLTHHGAGLFVPKARVRHIPPENTSAVAVEGEYRKYAAMIQNIAYTSFRLPHGRRLARTLPGNAWRFVRAYRWRPSAWADLARAIARGAILGHPAGAGQQKGS